MCQDKETTSDHQRDQSVEPALDSISGASSRGGGGVGWFTIPDMRYQNAYAWLIFVSAMDVMLTWLILFVGGSETNPIAQFAIDGFGLTGLILYKFALMVFVIIMCEIVGRKRDRTGLRLAIAGIAISSIPVVWSFILLWMDAR